jgi:hypothetical protein
MNDGFVRLLPGAGVSGGSLRSWLSLRFQRAAILARVGASAAVALGGVLTDFLRGGLDGDAQDELSPSAATTKKNGQFLAGVPPSL